MNKRYCLQLCVYPSLYLLMNGIGQLDVTIYIDQSLVAGGKKFQVEQSKVWNLNYVCLYWFWALLIDNIQYYNIYQLCQQQTNFYESIK